MARSHWTLGAGMVGCLYDYGPNNSETRAQALDSAVWYIDCVECKNDDEQRAFERMREEMLTELRTRGIFYFPQDIRGQVGADYIELTKQHGPCPESED